MPNLNQRYARFGGDAPWIRSAQWRMLGRWSLPVGVFAVWSCGHTPKEEVDMTDVQQQKKNGTQLVAWNPWLDMSLSDVRLGQLFDSVWNSATPVARLAPGGDLEETDDAFVIELDLPGIAKDDISIDVTGRRVSVSGTRSEKERTGILRHTTRTTGSFAYDVTLPGPVDEKKVTAALADGVLKLQLPKADGASTRIAIT
jgi:HSP20 family protein